MDEARIIIARNGMKRTFKVLDFQSLKTANHLVVSKNTGLIRSRDNLLAEQRELSKQKPRGKTDESLISEISRLESVIVVFKDDLVRIVYLW